MKSVLKKLSAAAKRIGVAVVALYRQYPARGNALIAAGVVGGLGAIGVSTDATSVKDVVAFAVPILLAGEATHRLVKPVRR